jgi:predicted NAD/FAD-dependent oxidoreductase
MIDPATTRIGIIGAGAAGLTAAEHLRQNGYENITILEKADRVGGKCCSTDLDGRMYELGAGAIARDQRVIMDLVERYDVPKHRVRYGRDVLMDESTGEARKEWNRFFETFHLGRQLWKYRGLCHKYAKAVAPGHEDVPEALMVPFSDWAASHGISELARRLEPYFTGYGYGYFSEIPAIYVMKYYPWSTVKSFMRRQIYTFPEGLQSLWETVASQHDVRLNAAIEGVVRGEKGVTVKTKQEDFKFDRLIVAAPLHALGEVMDWHKKEADLLAQVETIDYRTYAFHLKDFPCQNGYLPMNFKGEREGHPVFWYCRFPNTEIFTFYVIGNATVSEEVAWKNCEAVIEQLGGKVKKRLMTRRWDYFPHVKTEAMKAGFYDSLNQLQGKGSTYYVGELFNFSTVAVSAMSSEDLVTRHF